MIFLPNSFDRYLSSLRLYISHLILRDGLSKRNFEKLKKIYFAEALFYKNTRQNIDVNKLCYNLLSAVKNLKPRFDFKITASQNILINEQLLINLLLSLATETDYLKIDITQKFLIIKTKSKIKTALPITRVLKSFTLYEIKQCETLIAIPIKITKEKSAPIDSEWEYTFNKFSVVNMYLNNN